MVFCLFGFLPGCGLDKLMSDHAMKTKEQDKESQLAQAKPEKSPQINPLTHLAAGSMLEKQGDLKGAMEQYEKAVAANPKLPSGYNRLGIVYEKMSRFSEAEAIFRHGIDASPSSPSLHNNLGYCYLAQRRFDDAEEQLTSALAVSPEFKRARMNLGILYAQTGRLDRSLDQFKKVVSEDAANYNLAMICLSAGDYPSAEKSLKRALAINPNLVGAKQKLEQLDAWTHTGKLPAGPNGHVEPARKTTPVPALQVPLAGTADDEPSPPRK